MNALRTPEDRFAGLPNFEYEPQYVEVDGTRLAYVEAGADNADGPQRGDETSLCPHGEPTWSFLYRKMRPTLATRGRALALDLTDVTLVCQDWGGLLGLRVAALIVEFVDRT